MRHGIVGTGLLVLTMTMGSWFGAISPDARGNPAGAPAPAAVLDTEAALRRTARSPTVQPPLPSASPPPDAPAAADLSPPPDAPATAAPPTTAPGGAGDAARFLDDVNMIREREGIGGLERRSDLDLLARSWAETIAAEGSLRHSELIHDVIAGTWTTAGENVGYGPSAAVIFAALEASEGHLANMMNPDFSSLGIGVARVDGVVWTAHLFAG